MTAEVNDRERFETLAKLNMDLATRAVDPNARQVHEAWARFYKRLASMTA